jgi:hypothetical protein
MALDWQRLFPDSDFRFQMGLRIGDAKAFFAPEERFPTLTLFNERCRWLENWDEVWDCAAAVDDALDVVTQFVQTFHVEGNILLPSNCARKLAVAVGMELEPDWLLLRADENGVYRMIAGVICFPSGWAMREKMGQSIDAIHAIVPGLNAALGRQINAFLEKLAEGAAFERENWGLSADTELNHHPKRALEKLGADATLDKTWIRLERQVFYKLPRSGAIVFGIRVTQHLMSDVCAETGAAKRIARALESMPIDAAVYKGIDTARATLIAQLKALGH